ncbi:MAG TPA: choice-of-anchor Q domain-containing protein, partial [Verrucomicrobiae bacterium]|nr:choice-of-anchor Q domain-containing protein [Verrucomicrobiae bacterium]
AGGNIKNLYDDAALSLGGSIAGGGTASTGSDVSNDGTLTSNDYNIIQTPVAGTALSGTTAHDLQTDPDLLPLADNGGPTPTDADLPSSPGTDYIPFAYCKANGILVDQRGYPRDDGGDGFCDVGAFEYQSVHAR